MRYEWQACPNPDVGVLHVDRRMPCSGAYLASVTQASGIADDEDAAFFAELLDTPGVESLYVLCHGLQVVKGRLFDWRQIRPAVVEVFRRRFAPHGRMIGATEPVGNEPGTPIGWRFS